MTGYAAEGKSLARQDGKVIFIEGAVPGDVVDVFVSTNKKDYGEGRATHFHEYSTERTAPFCQHFGTCGGCKWQMLPYQKQLEYKQQEVAQNFRRIGKVELPEMMTIVGADNSIHYRNKLEFTFSNKRYLTAEEIKTLPPPAHLLKKRAENEIDSSQIDANQDIETKNINNNNGVGALGFHVPRIFDKIIEIQECFLMDDVNNKIRNCIRSFALENNQTTHWLASKYYYSLLPYRRANGQYLFGLRRGERYKKIT